MKKTLCGLAAGALLAAGPLVGIAIAHARLTNAGPAPKSTMSSPPTEVWAEFSENVEEQSRLEVYDPCGQQVDNGDSSILLNKITITMSSDKAGTYVVVWKVDSADGHLVSGDYWWQVTEGEPCPGSEPAPEEEDPDDTATGGNDDGNASDGSSSTSSGSSSSSGGAASNTGDGGSGIGNGGGSGNDSGSGSSDRPGGTEENPDIILGGSRIGTDPPSTLWDFPVGGLLVALGVSSLIGAAGGFVYAGIMGPRR